MSSSRRIVSRWLLALLCSCSASTEADAPHLYDRAGYQSPTRGDPDDLLQLAGDSLSAGDVAVYQAYSAGQAGTHPDDVPSGSAPSSGVLPIVSASGIPYRLVVRLPGSMLAGRLYHIWIRNPRGEWSNAVSINDSRPLWISPSMTYATAQWANLPRYLKIIVRNMPSTALGARLVGPKRYALPLVPKDSGDLVPKTYVLRCRLPKYVEPGEYRVELQMGDTTWVGIPDQTITVRPDPSPALEFNVGDAAYGRCRPDDGRDDTECLAKALEAASRTGGGEVVLGAGVWNLSSGIAVPPHVNIRGRGKTVTRVIRVRGSPPVAELILLGHNIVSDIAFADQETSNARSQTRPILQIGRRYNTDLDPSSQPVTVSEVTITRNLFDRTDGAIVDSGNPIEHLYVTYNEFGDYRLGLNLGGNRFNVHARFGVTDSVIAHNRFMPGSYLDLELAQGAIASEIGASRRLDFSSNVADGADRRFLYSQADAPGWRAAFFWHMNDNHEMLLISDNRISCSGDKDGDGEAIALDSNANTYALPRSESVVQATSDSVSVIGPLKSDQNDRSVDIDTYYVGHWVRIDAGPGVGQSRRIVAIHRQALTVTFSVDPPFDVVPEPNLSTASVAREYWQAMVLGNVIDQRKPLCLKSNRTRPKGGNISVWGESADSVIEGNRQYDTDGIVFEQGYGAFDSACADCKAWTSMPSYLEIRNNWIQGEYDWASACSLSGITGSYAASPSPHALPPLLSFGVSVSHNRVMHADGLRGGAISIAPTWFRGPTGYARPLLGGVIVDHNLIQGVSGAPPRPACGYSQDGRYGVDLQGDDRFIDGTVLYRNVCEDVGIPLRDHGVHTKRVCDQPGPKSCECTTRN
jgi:hypothetical protein